MANDKIICRKLHNSAMLLYRFEIRLVRSKSYLIEEQGKTEMTIQLSAKSMCRLILIAAIIQFATIDTAFAKCSKPIFPPLTYDRENWSEIEKFQVGNIAEGFIRRVQKIDSLGYGKINLDFYSITIDGNGESAKSLFDKLRNDLNKYIYSGTTYSVEPYDSDNGALWKSASPKGAVMTFTLATVPGVMPLERGSVIVSCFSPTDFIFSTIETKKDGLHPVSGNRAFGVYEQGNGSLSIFVKAADRIVNAGMFSVLPNAGRELIFSEGHKVWVLMLDNIERRFANRNPRDRLTYSVRVSY